MHFRTELTPKISSTPIAHDTPVVCVGSCFADRIGARLQAGKFKTLVNPFGVIFNPVSLFDVLRFAVEQTPLPAQLYTEREGLWRHYGVHSQFVATSKAELSALLEAQMHLAYAQICEAKFLMITLGTAWVYRLTAPPYTTVANCHKQPAHFFEKKLLEVHEIVASFEALQASLKAINPTLQVIFTVSPVRHLKDTLELNAVGKAVLRLAVHTLQAKYPHLAYFPAYELLLDDLRDYRFYAPDLLHPSEMGEQYIWEKFADAYFRPETHALLKKIQQINTSLAHRSLQVGKVYQNFLLTLQKDIEALPAHLDLQAEKRDLALRIISHDRTKIL